MFGKQKQNDQNPNLSDIPVTSVAAKMLKKQAWTKSKSVDPTCWVIKFFRLEVECKSLLLLSGLSVIWWITDLVKHGCEDLLWPHYWKTYWQISRIDLGFQKIVSNTSLVGWWLNRAHILKVLIKIALLRSGGWILNDNFYTTCGIFLIRMCCEKLTKFFWRIFFSWKNCCCIYGVLFELLLWLTKVVV